jgi:hypothetical protein
MTDEMKDKPMSTADIARPAEKASPLQNPMSRPNGGQGSKPMQLLDSQAEQDFRNRWTSIQGKFVDDPRSAVQEADTLVAELLKRIAEMFANERSGLELQWNSGNNGSVDTEALRIALQRYRSFFNRLLSL